MFLKCDPYRVSCSIFDSKLVNCILLRSLFVFVKARGTCGSGERNVKIWIDFWKSPRFPGIVVAILKMVTVKKFSMSGINSGSSHIVKQGDLTSLSLDLRAK
jgi:hypothetical protein